MPKEENSSYTSKTLKRKVNSICKYYGKAARTSPSFSSTSSCKVSPPLTKRRKILNMPSHRNMSLCGEQVKLSSEAEYDFVDLMYDEVLQGNIYTRSFSTMMWLDMRSKMFDRTSVVFSVNQMIRKLHKLEETWRKYNELMHASTEMRWNAETNLPQAEPIVWEELAKKNQEFLELRYKRFPHYLKLNVVFSIKAATCACARATERASTQRLVPRLQQSSHTENVQDVIAALAHRAERKESWSIEEVIKVLNTFDDLGSNMFNLALRHFQIEINRRTFMALSTEQRRSYILFNLST